MVLSPGLHLLLVERGFACRGRGQRGVGADLRRNLGSLGKPRFWRRIWIQEQAMLSLPTQPFSLPLAPLTH